MDARNKNIFIIAGALLLGLLLGWFFFGGHSLEEEHDHAAQQVDAGTIWTCSMHPQIRAEEPGKCPICGMELIPLTNAVSQGEIGAVQMTDYAVKLANIQTEKVGNTSGGREIRLNGKVAVDERAVYTQPTHIPGRIEQLMVNFTGEEVKRGQALAVIYSPELVTAQEELLQAYAIRTSQPELFEASKQKLRSWRIGENQINRILENGKASDRFAVTADVAGVVTEKLVELGDYVERGMPLYEIADLSKMWVLFDLYEKDMSRVKVGDEVKFTVASLPGETFTGNIDFIDPLINRQTRVATARISVTNKQGNLKPEMFVSGVVKNDSEQGSGQLSVPKSAVLWTGERSVVYVKAGKDTQPSFVLREVVLGPSLGNAYVLKEGLSEGEEIVVNGTFTVDAAAQLAGKPSMMNPNSAGKEQDISGEQEDIRAYLKNNAYNFRGKSSEKFQQQLDQLVGGYLKLKNALIEENEGESVEMGKKFLDLLERTDAENLAGDARKFWLEKQTFMRKHAQLNLEADDFRARRENFIYISEAMIKTIAAFGTGEKEVFVDYCPMANSNKGAYWLSEHRTIKNPYYGEAMLTCGEVVETFKK